MSMDDESAAAAAENNAESMFINDVTSAGLDPSRPTRLSMQCIVSILS